MRIGATVKKRGMWFGLLVLLVSQLLAACGGATPQNTEGPVDLDIWIYPAATEAGSPPEDWLLGQKLKDELGINVNFTFLPSGTDGQTKMSAAAAADDLPDLFQVVSTELLQTWIDQGLIAPVDDLLTKMPDRTAARYSDPDLAKLFTVDGQQYVLQEPNQLPKRQALYIRQDWLDKLNLDAPTSLDELLDVARAFTTEDPDGNGRDDTYGFGGLIDYEGMGSSIGLGSRFSFVYGAYGLSDIWNYKDPSKVSLSVRDPDFQAATDFIRSLNEEQVIDPDWPTLKKDEFRARWKQGAYGMMTEDFCALNCIANYTAFDTNFPEGEWALVDSLTGPNGDAVMGSYVKAGYQLAVAQKAIDEGKGDAIAKLLEWFNSGEGYELASFGEEGRNYEKDSSGKITTENVELPYTSEEGRVYVQVRNMALNGSPEELELRYPPHTTANGRTIDPMSILNRVWELDWIDATSTYVVEPSSNQTDINRFINENIVQFATGQKELNNSTWNEFIGQLDGLGVGDWEAAANELLKEKGFLS